MPSLAILEGLIGVACAIACLYYARLGALAGPQNYVHADVPWHSALGEYARRNPFAAVFGALALGFLVSSWSMYALPPRPTLAQAPAIEKWHTITRNVPVADPAQAARIASLQAAVDADTATIAAQTTELDRLRQLLGKSPRRGRRSSAAGFGQKAGLDGTAAELNKTFNPAASTAPANPPPSAPAQATTTPPTSPAQAPAAASQTPASTPPH